MKDTLIELGVGLIAFSPLAQGMLTDKYLDGVVSKDSRAAQGKSLEKKMLSDSALGKIRALNDIAASREQSLAQMAIAWILRDDKTTSALIGASKPEQVIDSVGALNNLSFSKSELSQIDDVATDEDINLWARSSIS